MRCLAIVPACVLAFAAMPSWAQTPTRAPSVNQTDREFVQQAAEGGMAEVELGRLAEQNAGHPAVREFGRWMVTDHTLANHHLSQIAQKAGIQAPNNLGSEHQAEKRKLESLKADAFDKAYIPGQVSDHEKTVALLQKEQTSGQDSALKQFAGDMLPAFQMHLLEAKELASLVQAEPAASGSSGVSTQPGGGGRR